MTSLYETRYGIFDHFSPEAKAKPMLSNTVKFGSGEELELLYEEKATLYVRKQIKKYFDYSLEEFLDLPRYQIQSLLRVADEVSKKDRDEQNSIEEQMSKLGLDLGKGKK